MQQTEELLKPESGAMKPEFGAPALRDVGIRAVMIPAFGVAVPYVSGYFGPYGPGDGRYWAGLAWSMLISCLIWHGNRYFLLKQRQHYDWFQHPVRKICVLLFANVFYTAPLSVAMLLAWYRFAGFGPDWNAIRTATLCCVICVVFITHVYETVYLIQQRETDLVAVTQAELEALKAQVTPHFLFNSLNTLSWLIEHEPAKAVEFNQDLAEVYRYILVAHRRELVPLEEELGFAMRYWSLLQLRFEDSLELAVDDAGARGQSCFLPPISIQVLLENAVKHNQHSGQQPLRIAIRFEEGCVVVTNARRPMELPGPTSKVGLRSLNNRCRLALGRGIEVVESGGEFTVRVPVRSY